MNGKKNTRGPENDAKQTDREQTNTIRIEEAAADARKNERLKRRGDLVSDLETINNDIDMALGVFYNHFIDEYYKEYGAVNKG